jgi:hypothetical protein
MTTQRTCTACGITDDHPRDVINVLPGEEPVNYHLDCHAALGCTRCADRLAEVGGVTGPGLRQRLLELKHGPLTTDQVAALVGGPAALEENQHG